LRNLKGFVFTVDAIFALIVAGAAIALIAYVNFVSPSYYQAPQAMDVSLIASMLQGNLGGMQGITYAKYAALAGSSTSQWPAFGGGPQLNSSSGYATQTPRLLFNYTIGSEINGNPVVADGAAVFTSGTSVYVINATTGGDPVVIDARTQVVGTPVIYHNSVLFANSSGYMSAFSENGVKLWAAALPAAPTSPLSLIGEDIGFGSGNGLYIVNAVNGTLVANAVLAAPAQAPAFYDGEYLVSTDSPSGQNYLYSYSLNGNTLAPTWMSALSTGTTTEVAVGRNIVAVGSGDWLYVMTPGLGSLAQVAVDGPMYGGLAAMNGSVYAYSTDKLYRITVTGTDATSYSAHASVSSYNSIPSVSYGTLYTSSGGNFIGYSSQSLAQLWNISLYPQSSTPNSQYSGVSLAYGNAYVTYGDTLYAFGSGCRADPGMSELAAVAYMYTTNQSACASMLLNASYPDYNVGVFVNNTYGPDVSVANFDGRSSYIQQRAGYAFMDNSVQPFTVSIWVNPSSPSGVVVDEEGQPALNTQWHDSMIELVNGNAYMRLWDLGCVNLGPVPLNAWSNIVMVVSGLGGTDVSYSGYINGKFEGEASGTGGYTRNVEGGGAPMFYSLGASDFGTNCGSGTYYSGMMADFQIYNSSLSASTVSQIYQAGAFGQPQSSSIVQWWPLEGDANDYSGQNFGMPFDISYVRANYTPGSMANAYQVSRESTLVGLPEGGSIKNFNVGVVVWR
jgi:hypothetical protein